MGAVLPLVEMELQAENSPMLVTTESRDFLSASDAKASLARIKNLVTGLPHLTSYDRGWKPTWVDARAELQDAVEAALASQCCLDTRVTEAYVRLGALLRLGADGAVLDPFAEGAAAQLARHLAGHLRLRAEFG